MQTVVARAIGAVVMLLFWGSVGPAHAQGFDLTLFAGKAYPVYDERLTFRPPVPSVPGVDITVDGSPLIEADGGAVFGGALAFEFGILGIEGRLDATDVALDVTGARYNLRGTEPPFDGVTGSISIGNGRFDVERIMLLSVNARIRTPGPIGLIVSGGASYLPDLTLSGTLPLSAEVGGVPVTPGFDPRVTLRLVPGQDEHRWGVNGGAGLRIGDRVAVIGEVRVFYFRDYELRFVPENLPGLVGDLVSDLTIVSFEPVFVNAQAGITFRF
jgi:hypothetical protein